MKNYRPISVLPVVSKLWKMLCTMKWWPIIHRSNYVHLNRKASGQTDQLSLQH